MSAPAETARAFASKTIAGGADPQFRLKASGYRPLYSGGARCPSCAGGAWHVGRASAECARCGTALPLSPDARGDAQRVPA